VALPGLRELQPTTRRLLLMRTLRSVGQGTLVVDFALYLHALQWSGVAIGLVLTAGGLFGAALSLLVGVSSDRLRRRPFLIGYEIISLLAAGAILLTARPVVLATAAIVAGFGRGANGAAGPFAPAEQAWLAEAVAPLRRGWVYSVNAALGFFGMGVGALFATLPSLWREWLGPALAYRPLFALVGLAAIANLFLLAGAQEQYHRAAALTDPEERHRDRHLRRRENRILRRLMAINGLNGLAIGLTGPLLSYWFALRFHVGPGAIAPVMAAAFLSTGLSVLLAGSLTQSIGIVRSVVWSRMIAVLLLVLLPLMPVYWLASAVYLLRSAFNRASVGARQAMTVGLVRDERRGLATSLNAVSMQLPRSAGPSLAGYLLDMGFFTTPFMVAAALQAAYVLLYGRTFREYEPGLLEEIDGAGDERVRTTS
jgi:predicted MFS family arabinose efflux permease